MAAILSIEFFSLYEVGGLKMVVELYDTSKVEDLFAGWQETLIYSCLQKIMGRIYVTDPEEPASAFAYVGCFGFVTRDFVSSFANKKQYLDLGRGIVILKDDKIVSGASSYTRYKEGIEIEVDTVESERRNHLATIACSALILRCLKENLYPSWDAQNINSVRLAEKLGYEFDHEYIAYEVDRT